MPRISSIASEKARDLAQYIGTHYGNGNDVLSRTEANRALKAIASDPVLATKMKDVFTGSAPNRADALIKALFEPTPPPPPPGGAIAVGSRDGGPGTINLMASGAFSLRAVPSADDTDPVKSAGTLYEAALLAGNGINPYDKANVEIRGKALAYLTQVAAVAAERAPRETTPSETTLAMKSGSATSLLALAKAAKDPVEAATRSKAIDTYLDVAGKEIHRGLRVSMALNLDAEKGQLNLSDAQKARLATLVGEALPSKPPYEEWFKGGNTTLNIKHYVHAEWWDLYSRPYTERGFKQTALPNGRVLWEKTIKDPSGRNPDTTFRIEAAKVADYSTDRTMLQDMNDPNTQIEIYTGHSNLGGNIAAALKAAPQTEVGTKLTFLWMCRGKQNVADFTNRFPKAHLITTHVPPDGYSLVPMLGALVDGVSRREDYAWIGAHGDTSKYHMFPNDRRLYDHRDIDKDGRLDGGSEATPDVVFDIYPRAPRGKAVDFKPGPSVDPAKVDGGPAANALAFANTLLTYHVEHGDGLSPITAAYGDHMLSEGFYKSDGDEFLRITPKTVNGATYYGVAFNSKYANQSEEALGMLALYELNRFISSKERGGAEPNLDDKLRGILLSSEYLAYMTGGGGYSDTLVANLAKANKWPSGITFGQLAAAIEKDSHGYVSMDSVTELKRVLGNRLGDGSQIR